MARRGWQELPVRRWGLAQILEVEEEVHAGMCAELQQFRFDESVRGERREMRPEISEQTEGSCTSS